MSRGFVSFLFFLLLAPLLLLFQTPNPWDASLASAPRILSLRRMELENNVDAIIREELFAHAHSNLPPNTIQLRVNARILDYLSQYSSLHNDFSSQSGFSSLNQTHYLSLLSNPLTFPTLQELQSSSYVIVLPVSQTERYLEYAYTGGVTASRVLHTRLRLFDSNSLFTIPIGYRICVTSFEKDWPCVVRNSS